MSHDQLKNESISLIFDLNTAILRKWEKANYWIAERRYCRMHGAKVYDQEVIRHIFELLLIVKHSFCKDRKKEFKTLMTAIENNNCDETVVAFDSLDQWLYEKGVTKFDTKQKYDRHRAEMANRHKGL